jgi:hypothetical protein
MLNKHKDMIRLLQQQDQSSWSEFEQKFMKSMDEALGHNWKLSDKREAVVEKMHAKYCKGLGQGEMIPDAPMDYGKIQAYPQDGGYQLTMNGRNVGLTIPKKEAMIVCSFVSKYFMPLKAAINTEAQAQPPTAPSVTQPASDPPF